MARAFFRLSFRGARISAFTRVFDALWSEPGIQMQSRCLVLDSGSGPSGRPGMTGGL